MGNLTQYENETHGILQIIMGWQNILYLYVKLPTGKYIEDIKLLPKDTKMYSVNELELKMQKWLTEV